MCGWDTLVLPEHLLDEGLSTAIAQRLSVSRRVIYHWIATGQLTRELDAPPVRRSAPGTTEMLQPGGCVSSATSLALMIRIP